MVVGGGLFAGSFGGIVKAAMGLAEKMRFQFSDRSSGMSSR